MIDQERFRTLLMLSAIVMSIVGVAAVAMPLKAQNREMLCQFSFPGCTQPACQDICDVYFPNSTGFCQGSGGVCCNCYF